MNSVALCVFSKGKPERTWTAEWLKTAMIINCAKSVFYVVSDDDDVKTYRKTTGCNVVVAKGAHNLGSKRRWAIENLTSAKTPWLLFMEDNIHRVTCVDSDNYDRFFIDKTTRGMFHDTELSFDQAVRKAYDDIQWCNRAGIGFGGFASNDNHFFRKTKYRHSAFVWSKLAYVRRGGPDWPDQVQEKDDYVYTGLALEYYGAVLVNNFIYPWPKKEVRGSSRSLEDRAEDRRHAVQYLLERFPDMFRVKERAGHPSGTEVQLRFTSLTQVKKWREKMGRDKTGPTSFTDRTGVMYSM